MRPRRVFLRGGLGLAGSLLLGCNDDQVQRSALDGGPDEGCDDVTRGLEFVERLGFAGESTEALERPFGTGLDGRLYTDLSRVSIDAPTTPNDRFYIRTRMPDRLVVEDRWEVAIADLDGTVHRVTAEALDARANLRGPHVLECSGNASGASFGLMSSAEWHGVPLLELLTELGVEPTRTRVLVEGFDEHSTPSANGHSTPGASWIFSFGDLEQTGAFLATRMNGAPLPPDHGAPVRLYVPGWYGCTCIKWVTEIRIVPDDARATSQMIEFASRTHQAGTPDLARDFIAPSMDVAAMPTRAERFRGRSGDVVWLTGIVWGNGSTAVDLAIQIGEAPFERVVRCSPLVDTVPWSLWQHSFTPSRRGEFAVRLRVETPGVRTRRLDSGHYERVIAV